MDVKKHWYNGQIVAETADGGYVVHYFGYKDSSNETMYIYIYILYFYIFCISKKEEIKEKIRPSNFYTPQFTNYKVGDEILYKGKDCTTVSTIEHIIDDSLELRINDETVTVKKNDFEHLFPLCINYDNI